MSDTVSEVDGSETQVILVRYWASARSAAGVDSDTFAVDGPVSLRDLLDRVVAAHPGSRLPQVLEVCSVLVGDRPVSTQDPTDVLVAPGASVEFLPPFAGG
ncbi:MoaD/ThiS family protein [Nocardioides dongxiaopingii]|uniref:MoaD/ThiS family protein n=1 Tax=Nocardioides TaxID=1839 RepID=UPI001BB0BCD0|nr:MULTISPECIES: MoaD/ThiS family protein [Nocardioides]